MKNSEHLDALVAVKYKVEEKAADSEYDNGDDSLHFILLLSKDFFEENL